MTAFSAALSSEFSPLIFEKHATLVPDLSARGSAAAVDSRLKLIM